MAKIIQTDNGYKFQCPGCGDTHEVQTSNGRWVFSGTLESPSIMPSILVEVDKKICHSLVTDGRIRFISDSTHQLSGKEVELNDI
jgi:hypothetical protein